jgi:hypothetical protein
MLSSCKQRKKRVSQEVEGSRSAAGIPEIRFALDTAIMDKQHSTSFTSEVPSGAAMLLALTGSDAKGSDLEGN